MCGNPPLVNQKSSLNPRVSTHQRVAFPLADGAAVVQRIVVVAADLPLMAAAVGIDDAVVVVAAADQHEDPLPLAVLDELHAVAASWN